MGGGGAFQPYLSDKDSLQSWVGSASSGRDSSILGSRAVQEAQPTPVRDTLCSHVFVGAPYRAHSPLTRE